MPVPDFQTLMLPLLKLAGDGQLRSLSEARGEIASRMELTTEDLEEVLPSGKQTRFANRVAWAKVYLERAGLLVSPKRGTFQITSEGAKFLRSNPPKITISLLDQFEPFKLFRGSTTETKSETLEAKETPEEQLEKSFGSIKRELAATLLEQVKTGTPTFFERLVVDLLLKMGYGWDADEAGKAIGKAGDEGIDGVIREDRLGLDVVYIQAKKWSGSVGRPEIQKFVGALHGKRARKGVFLTTGLFTAEARDYVSHIDPRVVLIDGPLLADYMIEHNVGVSVRSVLELKKVDTDYFADE